METVSAHGSAKQEIAGGNTRHACSSKPGDQITARIPVIVVEHITTGRVDEDPRCRPKGRSIHLGAFEERRLSMAFRNICLLETTESLVTG
jgi:hypothetical protein